MAKTFKFNGTLNATDSVIVGQGNLNGNSYSLVGGTTDKNTISNIIGTSINVDTTPASIEGDVSMAFGIGGTKSVSPGSIAIGYDSQAGIKGYYWWDILFNSDGTADIFIGTKQPSATYISDNSWSNALNEALLKTAPTDWAEGDLISLVNGENYPVSCQIKAINSKTKTLTYVGTLSTYSASVTAIAITVEPLRDHNNSFYSTALPFSTVDRPTLLSLYPNDYTIFAVCRKKVNNDIALNENSSGNGDQITLIPRSGTVNLGFGSLACGFRTKSPGYFSQALGWDNLSAGAYAVSLGRESMAGYASLGAGWDAKAIGVGSAAFNKSTTALGKYSFSANWWTRAIGKAAFAINSETTASGENSFAGGYKNEASGKNSFVIGNGNIASGENSFAGGADSHATGTRSFAFGNSDATGLNSVAFGDETVSSGSNTFTMGYDNEAIGSNSATFGSRNHSIGDNSIAAGDTSYANNANSFALGFHLNTGKAGQTVVGKTNIPLSNALFIVGNGPDKNTPLNALAVLENNSLSIHAARLDAGNSIGGPNSTITKYGTYSFVGGTASKLNAWACGIVGNANTIGYTLEDSDGNEIGYTNIDDNSVYIPKNRGTYWDSGWKHEYYYFNPIKEKDETKLHGENSWAEGHNNHIFGDTRHAHAEGGFNVIAGGNSSHAEGRENYLKASYAHVGGYRNKVTHTGAFVHGTGLKTNNNYQAIVGRYNEASDDIFIVGAGTEGSPENVFSVSDTTTSIKNQAIVGRYNEASDDIFIVGAGTEGSPENVFSVSDTTTSIKNQAIVGRYNDNILDSYFEVGTGISSSSPKTTLAVVDGTVKVFDKIECSLDNSYPRLEGLGRSDLFRCVYW